MSEHLCAHITIGGKLERSHLPELLKAITEAGVSLEWGDCCFRPATETDLLEARKNGQIFLCDEQARNGEFEELELTCRRLGLAYTRYSEGKYEYDPEIVDWRPGMKEPLIRRSSNSSEAIYVPASEVKKALQHLEAGHVRKAKNLLRSLCPEVPKLPVFKIV